MKNKVLPLVIHTMKLSIYVCVIHVLALNLLIARDTKGQKTVSVKETVVSVNLNNTSLTDAFKHLESISDYHFNYKGVDINSRKKLDLNFNKALFSDVLLHLSRKYELGFRQLNDVIQVVRYQDVKGDDIAEIIVEDVVEVSGEVTDENGEGLPGASIIIKGTSKGTTSDLDGKFKLSTVSDATLVVTFVGYITQEIPVGSQSKIDVQMVLDATQLDELIVVGYGTQEKVNLTGAVDVVTTESIESRSVTNLVEALQGMSPNLNVSTSGYESEPGGKMNFNIRGIGSLTGDDSPYVLVDGMPQEMNTINPSDIESITILKDAASAAIYGARAAYGVILITTKKGGNEEKISVQYSNNFSFSSPIGLPHMANSLVYANAHDQASVNAGLSPNFTPENYDRIRQYMAGTITDETWVNPPGHPYEGDYSGNGIWNIAGNGNNDWMYIYYDDMVMRQKHDVSISGGGKKNSYYVSAGLWDQPDELRFGGQFYKRQNVTANVSSKATDWLTFNFNYKFTKEHKRYFNTQSGWDRSTMYHNFYRTNAFRPQYLPNGEFSNISYIPMLNGGKENLYQNTSIITLSTIIEPVANWKTEVRYSYSNRNDINENNKATTYGSLPDGSSYAISYPISEFSRNFNNIDLKLFYAVSSYDKSFEKHNLKLMVGFEQQLNEISGLYGSKKAIVTPNVPSISTSTGDISLDDNESHWATQGVFGRFNYNYDEKYLLEINARYDGSSKFGQGNRWGFYPSVSVGYNISQESFWSSIEPVVNTLKIRGSWGTLGNQNVDNYLYLTSFGIGTNLGWIMGNERPNYTTAPGLVSPNLTWETSSTLNIGFDLSFLENRLGTSLDVFNRTTTDMFGPAEALPRTLGTSAPLQNNAELETKGFEWVVTWRDKIGDDFSYNARVVLADNKSIVKKYNNPTKTLSTWYEGQQIGEIWGLTSVGLYQSDAEADVGPDQSRYHANWGAGDMQYADLNNDGVIGIGTGTADDSGDRSIIGNNQARLLYGITLGADWKGFDMNIFWQGVGKRDFAFGPNDMTYHGFNAQQWWGMNVWEQTVDYWRPEGETNDLGPNTGAFYPKPYLSIEDSKNRQVQTRFMENASYLRLKNLTIGYTLPSQITEKIRIERARFYVSGENLLTITKLPKHLDPEALSNIGWGSGKVHPLRRVYSIGMNITL